jgi:gliding motility-associated-like protein
MYKRHFISFLVFFLSTVTLFASEPTVAASNGRAGSIQCDKATISWTSGNGAWRMVLVRKDNPVSTMPTDGTAYTPNNTFTAGQELGTGNFVCYNNVGNNFTLSGLQTNTRYHVAIIEHSGSSAFDYLTSKIDTFSFVTQWLNLDFSFTVDDSCDRTNLVTFTNKTTASYTGLTYKWILQDGNEKNGTDITHTYMEGGNYQVVLIASPNLGCKGDFTNSNAVRIIPRPVSKPIEMNGKTEQCLEGNEFRFSDVTTIKNLPQMAYVRTWYFAADDSSTIPRPVKKYTTPGVYRIGYKSETFFDNKPTGCTDTTSLYITVVPSPSSGIDINDSIQCLSSNNFIFDNVYPGLVAFSWDLGDGTTSTNKKVTHQYATAGTYRIIHEAESTIGCKSKDTVFVSVKPNVTASFTGLPPQVCEDGPSITLNPNNPNGVFSATSGTFSGSNYNPGPAGNHTVKFVVRDSFCPDSVSATILVVQRPQFSLGRDTTLCDGAGMLLSVTAPGTLNWENGATTSPRAISGAGKYWATVNNNGCSWTDTINVFEATTPVAQLPGDTFICKGSLIKLSQSWPNATTTWSTGARDTVIYLSQAGTYVVTLTNACGSATDDIIVRVSDGFCDIFPPTAFTPNGDGRNDYFEIIGRDVDAVLLQIFNRWGELVFDSERSGDFRWYGDANGEPCMQGNYPYIYRYEQKVGDRVRRTTYKGAVWLMR